MGVLTSPLPKPVDSILVQRCGTTSFKIGVAGMNGWRPSNEDTHLIHVRDDWGFFGVFDGHGGTECSEFIARRLQEELENGGKPEDDAALKALMLRLDQEFLESAQRSGSTGTFAIIEKPAVQQGHHALRIGNTGDSRILLGCENGDIFHGPGTDSGLTTDHRPDLPSEKLRIERTEHQVRVSIDGVARVGGELTVSRAFGNKKYKQSAELDPQDQAVSAEPEFGRFPCEGTDFLMLICDGVCEGSFSNSDAVALAASQLKDHGDPGRAAAAVCRKALAQSSRDNLTCMIVLLSGGALGPDTEFLPGSFSAPGHDGFIKAYENAAHAAGLTLSQAVEQRYDFVKTQLLGQLVDERRTELQQEVNSYQGGPPTELATGCKERIQWFEDFISGCRDNSNLWAAIMMISQKFDHEHLALDPWDKVKPREQTSLRQVMIPSEDVLRPAISRYSALKWEPLTAEACNKEAQVVEDDASDGTSMVQYGPGFSTKAWLPTAVLIDV